VARRWGNIARELAQTVGFWLVVGLITYLGVNVVLKVEATGLRLLLVVVVFGVAFGVASLLERFLRTYTSTGIHLGSEPAISRWGAAVPKWLRWPLFAACVVLALGVSVTAELQQAKTYRQSQPAKVESGNEKSSETISATNPQPAAPWYSIFANHPTDWLLVLFNGLLALFTFRLFRATSGLMAETAGLRATADEQRADFLRSVVATEKAAIAADASADAGKRQLQHLEETAKRQLRAYISVEPRGVRRFTGTNNLLGHIEIRNVGGIPAKNISMFAVTDWSPDGSRTSFEIGKVYPSKTALPPGAEMVFGTSGVTDLASIERDPGTPSDWKGPGKAPEWKGFIFVYGKVTYTDEFKTDGWTEFCHRYPCAMMGSDGSISQEYARYHELAGNDAN
jgi:hypothetical protein